MKKYLIMACIFLTAKTYAISEVHYQRDYRTQILPVIDAYQYGHFKGAMGLSIHYASYTTNSESSRCLVILPGRTEAIEKYAEVVHSLDSGTLAGEFTFFLMDHRGQGSSERMIKEGERDSEKSHIDRFEYYALDLKRFMDQVVKPKNCREHILLAHSMGGGIGVDFLEKYPGYFDKAALSSPMLKIQTGPFSYGLAQKIVAANIEWGNNEGLALGEGLYEAARDFAGNTFTSSPERYEMAKDLFDWYPDTRLGGVTYGWLSEVFKGTEKIRQRYDRIKIPLQVFYVGLESYVETAEIIRFCQAVSHCERTFFGTSKHEVLMDRDVNRDIVIKKLEDFFGAGKAGKK